MLDAYCTSGTSPTRSVDPDFVLEDHGSVFLLRPISPASFIWIGEHIPEDAQWFGNAVAVEHRYIGDIVDGIASDGLEVSQ